MKQLYRPRYISETIYNNKGNIETIKYESSGYYYIKYGEPDERKLEISEWKDLLFQQNYCDDFDGYKDRKGRLWCQVNYTDKHGERCQKKLYKDQFISAKSYFEISIINPKDIKMDRLIKDLNADEFIEYLKDNGIRALPTQ